MAGKATKARLEPDVPVDEIRQESAELETTFQSPKGAPSFGMCQGTREEIERTGTAVDPFTGRTLTRDDL